MMMTPIKLVIQLNKKKLINNFPHKYCIKLRRNYYENLTYTFKGNYNAFTTRPFQLLFFVYGAEKGKQLPMKISLYSSTTQDIIKN